MTDARFQIEPRCSEHRAASCLVQCMAICRLLCVALFVAVSTVTLVDAQVRVDDDLYLGTWTPSRKVWERAIPVCVFNDSGLGAYRLIVLGNALNTSFAMHNDIGDDIPYRLRWFARGSRGQRETLQPGVPSRRSYAFHEQSSCHASDVPHLEVRVDRRLVDRAPPGIYRDTLRVTIAPL